MKVIVLGATGATGRKAVDDLLRNRHEVIALVRNNAQYAHQEGLTIVEHTTLSMASNQLSNLLQDSDALISCLGHNHTLKGMYGAPRMLVRDSIQRIVRHTNPERTKPLKLVLMSSSGVRNLNQSEPISIAQHTVLSLLRILIPPHLDNERAANFLRTQCANQKHLKWIIVRPDTLVNEEMATTYEVHVTPIRSALFDPGKVSRVNVATFMSRLIQDPKLWQHWQGKMPVIYGTQVNE